MRIVLRVFLPFAIAYTVAYLLRVINAVAGEPISADLGLTPGALGLLTSLYFMGFGLAQLPAGILMDRFGPRRVEGTFLLLAAAGCGLYALASDFADLALGRTLMGIGLSVCLMAPFTAYYRWFSPAHIPLVNGFQLSFGAAGGVLGGGPTDHFIDLVGWPSVFAAMAGIVLVLSVVILLVVPREREPTGSPKLTTMTRQIGSILKSPQFWRIAPLSTACQATLLAIGSLWTGPWLRQVAELSPQTAANWLSLYSAALIVGFLGFGWLMNRFTASGGVDRVVSVGLALFVLVQAVIVLAPPAVGTLAWVPYNVFGSVGALTYAIAARSFAPEMGGRVNTTLNFVVFLAAFLTQWLFGVLLDPFVDDPATGFALGFAILIGLQIAAAIPWFLIPARPYRRENTPEAGLASATAAGPAADGSPVTVSADRRRG